MFRSIIWLQRFTSHNISINWQTYVAIKWRMSTKFNWFEYGVAWTTYHEALLKKTKSGNRIFLFQMMSVFFSYKIIRKKKHSSPEIKRFYLQFLFCFVLASHILLVQSFTIFSIVFGAFQTKPNLFLDTWTFPNIIY